MKLAEQHCRPVSSDEKTLDPKESKEYIKEIPDWKLGYKMLRHEFMFDNFDKALEFIIKVSNIAKEESHHPNVCLYYNRVEIVLTTNKIGGLSINDFIMAAKIDLIACTPEQAAMHEVAV